MMRFENRYRSTGMILAGFGLLDSLYLTVIKLTNNQGLCLQGVGDCWAVNTSRFSEFAGIPISILGAGAYLTILILLFLEARNAFWLEYSPLFVFGITLAGLIYSAYLTYIEIAVIKAICPFCVVSAVLMAVLFVLAFVRLFNNKQVELNTN